MHKYKYFVVSFFAIASVMMVILFSISSSKPVEVPKESFIITQSKSAPPFSFLNGEGEAKGILIDYWKAWAKENDVTVQFILTDWKKSLELVENGDADFHGGAFYSDERDRNFDFAQGIFQDKTCIFVRTNIDIDSIEDINRHNGLPIWVVEGDRTQQFIQENHPLVRMRVVNGSNEFFKGSTLPDAFALDYYIAMYYFSKYDLMGEYEVVHTLYNAHYRPVVKEGDKELLAFLNETVKAVNNEEKDKILNQWIRFNVTIADSFKKTLIMVGSVFFLLLLLGNIIFLRRQVQERTNILNETNKKLKKENKRRKEAESILVKKLQENQDLLTQTRKDERFKNDFFINFSHELRTPLNVIMGTIQLIEFYEKKKIVQEADEKFNERLRIIKQNCYRLIKVVNNLIDVSKLEVGQYNMKKQNINIVYVIEEVAQSVSEYIKFKDLELIIDTDTEETILACDPIQIERVILNILSNAIKFSPKGGTIQVNMSQKGGVFITSIRDEGIGIPKDKQESIFDRFEQVDTSLSRNQEGSGIGLALVQSIIRMHGGTIRVISDEGQGSEFVINLPVILMQDKENQEQKKLGVAENISIEKINIEFSDIYFME